MVVFCVGEWVPCSVGGNFTPHVIAVNAGEVNSLEVFFDRSLSSFYNLYTEF